MVKKVCAAIARQQQQAQRVERPKPAVTAEAPTRAELIFGPAQPTWKYSNPRSEIAVKPRSRVLWSR
jgi:hypothetical protein